MLLVKKDVFMPTTEQKIIFGYMGYAAYKLWNVGNYEKLNYKKLGMTAFPNWYDQKKRLKDNFFYKNLPSQTAQDVLQQLQEAWVSFFTLKKTGGVVNPKPPRFKHQNMSITFLNVKRHFLSGVNGGLQSVTVESNGILYSQAAGCQQYNGMFS